MLNISIICFSLTGEVTATEVADYLKQAGYEVELARKSKYLADSISVSLSEWTRDCFERSDVLIFVGACGIAVRSIAPYVKKKTHDPAVIVIDECKKHIISLLSGHIGGANELTLKIATALESDPVITTATDLHQQFAVDVFAVKNHCAIHNMTAAKLVSADLLAGNRVGFYSEFAYDGLLPEQLTLCDENGKPFDQSLDQPDTGIVVSVKKGLLPFRNTVTIIPKVLTLGIGCKKDTDKDTILMEVRSRIFEDHYWEDSFSQIASIDLKKEEIGIIFLASHYGLPYRTYTAEELMQVSGAFTESAFVKSITGVSNVCERSAVLASNNGKLIENKIGKNGVTTAVACEEWRIHFG